MTLRPSVSRLIAGLIAVGIVLGVIEAHKHGWW